MKHSVDLRTVLLQADAARRQNSWDIAAKLYALGARALPQNASIRHNQALCALGLSRAEEAIALAGVALKLNPGLWQSELVCAKAHVALGRKDVALSALRSLHQRYPENADVRLELASLLLHELGDAHTAREIVAPLLNDPVNKRDAELSTLISQLYDRDEEECSAESVNESFKRFAQRYLATGGESPVSSEGHGASKRRPRVGFISPQLSASPVYYLTYGALRELAGSVDLIFIHRDRKTDWATDSFKSIAKEWVQAESQAPEQLRDTLRRLDLDALFDLGGWMDATALQAMSTKPVPLQYKWVGGQSITTGLHCFDGWLSDRYQTPVSFQKYYTEPLVLLEGGYVTYTPPAYLPQGAPAQNDQLALGVIANPAKVSRPFLADLDRCLGQWYRSTGQSVELCFIDKRYRHPELQARITRSLPNASFTETRLKFVSPASHLDYLTAVSRLDAVLDTYPYTGGLTTLEALFMGVPCRTVAAGTLFCERHTYAHCRYAGLTLAQMALDRFLPDRQDRGTGPREATVQRTEKRVNHGRLAEQLLALVRR